MASLTLELTRLEAEPIIILRTPEREPDENLSILTTDSDEGRASRLKRVLPAAVACTTGCSCGWGGGAGGAS